MSRKPPVKGNNPQMEKPKDLKNTIKKLLKYLSGYKLSLIIVLILTIN